MEGVEYSSNLIDQIVITVLLGAAVAIVTAVSLYFLTGMYLLASEEAPAWLFFLAWIFAPMGGAILIILGIWQKVVRHDTLGWYGGIIGVGIGMIIGYAVILVRVFYFVPTA